MAKEEQSRQSSNEGKAEQPTDESLSRSLVEPDEYELGESSTSKGKTSSNNNSKGNLEENNHDDQETNDPDAVDDKDQPRLPWPLQQDPSSAEGLDMMSGLKRVYMSMSFSYMNPILTKGRNQFKAQNHLKLSDLYRAPKEMEASRLVEQFWFLYDKNDGHLKRTVWQLTAPAFVPAGFWEFIFVVARVSMPLSLRELLIILESNPNQSVAKEGLKYAIFMTVASALGAVAQNRTTYLSTKAGIVLRAALTSAIYEHTLRLSPGERANLTTGEITNLVAIDTQKLFDVYQELHNAWSCPLLIVVVTALLWIDSGPELTLGVAVLIMFLPVVKAMVGRMLYLRKDRSKLTDVRVNVLASMLQGIRVTKLNHYEAKVEGAVRQVREEEMSLLKRELSMWGWVLFAAIVSPLIATAAAFIFYALRDPENNLITPSKAFSSLLLLSILRFPINLTSRLVGKLASANEGLRRIALFLGRPVSSPMITRSEDDVGGEATKADILGNTASISSSGRPPPSSGAPPEGAPHPNEDGGLQTELHPVTNPNNPADALGTVTSSDEESTSSGDAGDSSPHVLTLRHGSFMFKPKRGGFLTPELSSKLSNDAGKSNPSAHSAPNRSDHNMASMHSHLTEGGEEPMFCLHDIDFTLKAKELIMVVGKVGSGKTLLLNALLGELPASSNKTMLEIETAKLSYAPQIPFILNQTLRDNVLFGSAFNRERYELVVDACCLREDMELLGPSGDLTQIGERGVTLSGGQKARVGLARAAYAEADLVLLDDPFSALDSSTARAVFDGLFDKEHGVLRNAGTILVTHAVHFLPRSDRILVLHDGACSFAGTWNDLRQAQGDDAAQSMDLSAMTSNFIDVVDEEDYVETRKKRRKRKDESKSVKDGIIMTVEEREYGVASLKVWMTWFANAGGWGFFLTQVVFLVLDRGIYVASDWWLAKWSNSVNEGFTMFGKTFAPQTDGQAAQVEYVKVYATIVLLSCVATAFRNQWSFNGGARCAKKMFYAMTHSVLRAPMLYFETTPLGRILNRFTYDVEVLDVELSVSMTGLLMSGSWLLASIIVMVAVLPWILLGIVPVGIAYLMIQQFYRMSGPDLQRLDAISRSPLQAGLSEGMEGTTSIRAFRKEGKFAHLFREHVDKNTSAMINFLAAQRWLGLRIELLGTSIGLALTATIVCANGTLNIAPGFVGFVIQWGVVFSAALNFFFLRLSESEARITSIERVNDTSKLDQEAEWETDSSVVTLDKSWPARGELVFDSVFLRYRKDLPLSLNSVSFHLKPAMRCGIVGRTGSGKSSLTAALFRLVELEGGRILLDGVDLSKIGLSDLRGRANGLRILPQDPVLYAGTLRDCLDPFQSESNERIMDALRAVRHKGAHNRGADLLEDKVEEGGANFSVGERQLLCLARAIVEEPRVLVLDEATASVDTASDAVIQEMLRTRFQNTTLFTVAHRLQTIMDYDVVAVMDSGRCAEFGPPRTLLENPNGLFSGLVDATGPESAAELRRIANEQKYIPHDKNDVAEE